MSAPLYSIVTVVRNDLPGLRKTHASLAIQDCRDFEWIVVDGDSTDGTREWLATHESDLAWWRSAPDQGLYDAMNIGLAASQGRYLLFLNAGDTLSSRYMLTRLTSMITIRGFPDFCYGDALEGYAPIRAANGHRTVATQYNHVGHSSRDGLSYKPARSHRSAWYGMFTHHQAMVYRRDLLKGLRFSMAYPVAADYAFTLQVLARAETVAYLSQPFCVFAGGGLSQQQAAQGRRDQVLIRRDVLKKGFFLRTAIAMVQSLAWLLREFAPALYYLFRYRKLAQHTVLDL